MEAMFADDDVEAANQHYIVVANKHGRLLKLGESVSKSDKVIFGIGNSVVAEIPVYRLHQDLMEYASYKSKCWSAERKARVVLNP